MPLATGCMFLCVYFNFPSYLHVIPPDFGSSLQHPVHLAWHSLKWIANPSAFRLGGSALRGMQNVLSGSLVPELANHLILMEVYCSVGLLHFS